MKYLVLTLFLSVGCGDAKRVGRREQTYPTSTKKTEGS